MRVYDFSTTGNLTLFFNKPIILPPIEVYNLTDTTEAQQESETTSVNGTKPEPDPKQRLLSTSIERKVIAAK